MSIKPIPELDSQGLRKFAFTSAAIIVVLFALVIPFIFSFSFPVWPWIAGVILAGWGAIAPATLNPVYKVWMRFGLLMNRITTPIILGIVFFLVFTPIALVMRLFGRDELQLKRGSTVSTYRVVSKNSPKEKMEKPF